MRIVGWRSVGVRGRVTVAFTAGALALSLLLATVTWTVTSSYLLRQREIATLRLAALNALVVQDSLVGRSSEVPLVLDNLPTTGSDTLLFFEGQWFGGSLELEPDRLPDALRQSALGGKPVRQRVSVNGEPRLIVGVPLPRNSGAYFESFPLDELDQAMRTLSTVLVVAGALTTVLGAALGQWASRRSLRPLTELSRAAGRVAAGRLDTRLSPGRDPDLSALAASFNQTAAQLQHRVELDARFASDVSHELRSPLTTMVNAVELLKARQTMMPSEGREALGLLSEELHRFERLVEDLLEISMDTGDGRLVLEPVSLGELVRRAADEAAGRPVTDVAADAKNLVILADRRRIARVVHNLVNNAASHGGGVLRVTVERSAGAGIFAVEDAGPGVPAEERDRIFERFARVTRAYSREAGRGVGLGLALVAQHVQLHGGRVWVEDRPGGGARFVVELPHSEA